MQVVFSPCLPQSSCLYIVAQNGLQGVDKAGIVLAQQATPDVRGMGSHQHGQLQSEQQPYLHRLQSGAVPQSQVVAKTVNDTVQMENTADSSLYAGNKLDEQGPLQNGVQHTACQMATGVFALG